MNIIMYKKKIYSFHNDIVRKHLEEIALTNSTICTSPFICSLILKKWPTLKCTKVQRLEPKYIYSYVSRNRNKRTRTYRNKKLCFNDFKRGHWNRDQIKSMLVSTNYFQNPHNIPLDYIDRLFETKDDNECKSIIYSLFCCAPSISIVKYYKIDYLISI